MTTTFRSPLTTVLYTRNNSTITTVALDLSRKYLQEMESISNALSAIVELVSDKNI